MKKGKIIINLNQPISEIWKQVDKKNRWSVNKARDFKFVFKQTCDKEDYYRCYRLYKKTCEINYLKIEPSEKLFENKKTFILELGDELVCFTNVVEQDGLATFSDNATDGRYKETQANSLMYWKLIETYHSLGFKGLSLGGIDLNADYRHGSDVFKIRWGGDITEVEGDGSFLEWLWWKYFRHFKIWRWSKWTIQNLKRR